MSDDDKPKGTASDRSLRNKLGEAGLRFTADGDGNAVVNYGGELWTVRATEEGGYSVSTPGKTTQSRGINSAADVASVIKGGRPRPRR